MAAAQYPKLVCLPLGYRVLAESYGDFFSCFSDHMSEFVASFSAKPKGCERYCQTVANLAVVVENRRADSAEAVHHSFAAAERKTSSFYSDKLADSF
jgi:hypothetical protein